MRSWNRSPRANYTRNGSTLDEIEDSPAALVLACTLIDWYTTTVVNLVLSNRCSVHRSGGGICCCSNHSFWQEIQREYSINWTTFGKKCNKLVCRISVERELEIVLPTMHNQFGFWNGVEPVWIMCNIHKMIYSNLVKKKGMRQRLLQSSQFLDSIQQTWGGAKWICIISLWDNYSPRLIRDKPSRIAKLENQLICFRLISPEMPVSWSCKYRSLDMFRLLQHA